MSQENFDRYRRQQLDGFTSKKILNKKVYLPFMSIFETPMKEGKKTWTSRSHYMGDVGDWFEAFGETFDIVERKRMSLKDVVENHYAEEGFSCKENMIRIWCLIHPIVGYDPERRVSVHVFRRRN